MSFWNKQVPLGIEGSGAADCLALARVRRPNYDPEPLVERPYASLWRLW